MRMLLPGVELRRRIRVLLSTFYNDCQYPDFNAALRLLAEFYKVPVPAVEWYEYLDNRKTLGPTWDAAVNGKLELIDPENGVGSFLHEFYHVLHFVEEETKADRYAASS